MFRVKDVPNYFERLTARMSQIHTLIGQLSRSMENDELCRDLRRGQARLNLAKNMLNIITHTKGRTTEKTLREIVQGVEDGRKILQASNPVNQPAVFEQLDPIDKELLVTLAEVTSDLPGLRTQKRKETDHELQRQVRENIINQFKVYTEGKEDLPNVPKIMETMASGQELLEQAFNEDPIDVETLDASIDLLSGAQKELPTVLVAALEKARGTDAEKTIAKLIAFELTMPLEALKAFSKEAKAT
ncbi:MAG: hypothetical protein QGF25_01140 [Candidatus Woesearchaeota archaeon]|jgi:hypothetical protein|nr:hypothetical protein [Candidatus Woesearchaeota archaeon]MDP7466837.1 hypothetical protein [Candidatus Woesearchaeota archaeon]MDP7648063.1 hypothetical protein [Candidatus Woesearchaeota archaeon]